MRVVLVRPWTDAHAGGGCCSGDPRYGVAPRSGVDAPEPVDPHRYDGRPGQADGHDHEPAEGAALVGEVYRRLRREHPDVDVQVVGSSNTAYLLPSTFRAARRARGVLGALREATRSTTAGSLLVDGIRVGDVETLGVEGVLREVGSRTTSTP